MKARSLSMAKKPSVINILSNLQSREASIQLKQGELIDGIIREVDLDSISISKYGEWNNKVRINVKDIIKFESSDYPYFSMKHKRSLRERKIPRMRFRYSESQLKELEGRYAFINYDGKLIDGEIIKTKSYRHNNSITLKTDNDLKEIMCYQLRDLEITGVNEREHEGAKLLREIESELIEKLNDYIEGDPSVLSSKQVNPDDLIEKYFEAKIKQLKGEKVSFAEFSYLWTQEIFKTHGESKGKTSMKDFSEDMKEAKQVNNYYNRKIEFVDLVVDTVCKVDWTKYSKSQSSGEIEALEYLYELGLF